MSRNLSLQEQFGGAAPSAHVSGLLIHGDNRQPCRVHDFSNDCFTIAVPAEATLRGSARAKLLVDEVIYDVNIDRKYDFDGETRFVLHCLESPTVNNPPSSSRRWLLYSGLSCALIVVLTCFAIAVPGSAPYQLASEFNWQSGFHWPATPSNPSDNAAVDSLHPPGNPQETIDRESNGDSRDNGSAVSATSPSMESVIPGRRVSLSLQRQAPTPKQKSAGAEPDKINKLNAGRRQLLQAAITSAGAQRSRPLNATTLPWLFSTPGRPASGLQRCRMTDSAMADLQTFHGCLTSLTATEVAEVTKDLMQSLTRIVDAPASIPSTVEFPSVRRICNADAELYFRIVDGEPELLRVLPVDIESDVPFGPKSDAIRRTAAHR